MFEWLDLRDSLRVGRFFIPMGRNPPTGSGASRQLLARFGVWVVLVRGSWIEGVDYSDSGAWDRSRLIIV